MAHRITHRGIPHFLVEVPWNVVRNPCQNTPGLVNKFQILHISYCLQISFGISYQCKWPCSPLQVTSVWCSYRENQVQVGKPTVGGA